MAVKLSEDARLVLALIRDHPGLTIEEMTLRVGKDDLQIEHAVRQLLSHGSVLRVHEGRRDETGRYYPA